MDTHQTSVFTAILIACAVIGIIIVVFIISMIRNQRRNRDLYKSKILAEITTLEKERSRIASDLHDELGPVLSSIKYRINSFDISSEDDQEQVNKVNQQLDKMITQMRAISNDLLPITLIRKGLVVAVQEIIDNIGTTAGLTINFTHSNIPDLTHDRSVNLYRILMEVIHNTIKHAKASILDIELKTNDDTLIILTKDNGIGFNYNNAIHFKTGLGLRNLLSRAEVMGGEMFIESKPGKGTRYIFEIPLV